MVAPSPSQGTDLAITMHTRDGHVAVTGGRIWYRVVGAHEATPLVTVHGGPGATHDYLEGLQALADRRPVVSYYQLGAGRSDAPDDLALWTNQRLVDELGRLLDTLGLDRVQLLGQSCGTIIAAKYVLVQPSRVAGLVLSDPVLSLPRYAIAATQLRAALPADVREVLDHHEAAGTIDTDEYQAAYLKFFPHYVCRADPIPEPLKRTFAQLNEAIFEHMQGPNEMLISGTHRDYDLTDRLDQLTIPTLFICGRHGTTRPEDTASYQERVAGAELVVFEHSSHLPHLEETDAYLATLRDFLERTET